MFKDDLGYTLLGGAALIGVPAALVVAGAMAFAGPEKAEINTQAETVIKEVVIEKPVEVEKVVKVDNPKLLAKIEKLEKQNADLLAKLENKKPEVKKPEVKHEEKKVASVDAKLTKEQEWSKKFVEGDVQTKVTMVAKKHESTAASLCRQAGKMSSKFPSKVDWKWGYDAKRVYWTDGSDVNAGQLTITRRGEAMNGFGNMIPFAIECKFAVNVRGADIHPTTMKWISGGQVNTLLDLPAPNPKDYKGKVFTPVKY
jgi:hypothetical protein